jgi:hypothetical protein
LSKATDWQHRVNNPFEPPQSYPTGIDPPATLPSSSSPYAVSWQGARAGFRGVSIVAIPLALLILTIALIPTAVGLGSGRGFGLHPGVFSAIAV